MSDKPDFDSMIDHGGVLEVHGRDAEPFCQAQFMSDVGALDAGRWHWSGWLSARGRVEALFALIRLEPARFWLWLPDRDPGDLAEALRRFVFRSRVELSPRDGVSALMAFPDRTQENDGGDEATIADGGIELDLGAEGGDCRLRLSVAESAAGSGSTPDGERHWRLHAIRHGLPRLTGDAGLGYTPHMLSLDRLAAFSVRKGCYPGQEIVSRTHFLGQAKRGLARVCCEAPLAPGEEVSAGAHTLGTILSAVASDVGTFEALAVLPRELPPRLTCGDRPLRRLPLLGGLERPRGAGPAAGRPPAAAAADTRHGDDG